MAKLLSLLVFLSVAVLYSRGACTNPSVTSETYSTNDVLLSTETAFLIKVNVKCDGGDSLIIHGLVDGQLIQAARSARDNEYQVSWTESHESAATGQRTIKFFDDEGTAAIKKSARYGEELTAKPLFSVNIDHRGARSSLWIAPSFIAMVIALLVWWLAFTTKTKIQD
ncbi:translocon-associated protein subunit delta-like [Halichondria panicea]|uniref:translocon-associated protein subunit delta-like n=1 Tax=Halichondria panicea TaxID=6063 RepID=UPI00312B9B5D